MTISADLLEILQGWSNSPEIDDIHLLADAVAEGGFEKTAALLRNFRIADDQWWWRTYGYALSESMHYYWLQRNNIGSRGEWAGIGRLRYTAQDVKKDLLQEIEKWMAAESSQ